MLRFRITDRVKFMLERLFVRGAHFQLLAVAGLIGLVSVAGGILVLPAGAPVEHPAEAIWWAFLRLTDPGYLGDDQGAWRRIVSTALTVMGYVLFMGSLVAIMTQWLHGKMRQLEQGLTPVTLKNHVVLLGWTNRTLPVLREMVLSTGRLRRFLKMHGSRRLRLVVLDEDISAQRAQALRDDPHIRPYSRDIILRSGSRLHSGDLRRAACFQAAAIILPSRVFGGHGQVSADVETIKTLLSLEAGRKDAPGEPPYVVAEIQDVRKVSVAQSAYQGPLEVVAGDSAVGRLLAQNIRLPGLSHVYNELLSHGQGNEFYVRRMDDLAGKRLAEVEPLFSRAIVCGLVRLENNLFVPVLNAPADTVLRNGDRIVLLARSLDDTDIARPSDAPVPPLQPRAPSRQGTAVPQRRVLILGWNNQVPALLAELGTYAGEHFQVDILSTLPAESRRRALAQYGGTSDRARIHHLEGDFLLESELRRLAPGEYQHILLSSSDRLPSGEEADARTIVGFLLLEGLLRETDRPRPQVLLELSDPANAPLVDQPGTEVLVSSLILSHVLAQVALRRELRVVFDELFTAGGPEILFRTPADYGETTPQPLSFGEARALASRHGDIAIGLYDPAGTDNALRLNPEDDSPANTATGGLLVVIGAA